MAKGLNNTKKKKDTTMLPPIKQLLEKPMDRKEFLKYTGVGLLMVVGVGSLLQSIQRQLGYNDGSSEKTSSLSSYGYGGNVYGGRG